MIIVSNGTENKGLSCEIVRDLLPLYCDGVVSEATQTAVREHLEDCEICTEEYNELCAPLPIEESEPSTLERFKSMMQKQKIKRALITVIAVIVTCGLLAAAYFGQSQLPIIDVPADEIVVHGAYRYETEEGYKFFVLHSIPSYDYCVSRVSEEETEYGRTLVMSIKKPLISRKNPELNLNDGIMDYECGYDTGGENGELVFEDFDALKFGGQIVWTKAENADDEIPDYVHAYRDFTDPQGGVSHWFASSEEGYFGVVYDDGRTIHWDFDGNVLYDSEAADSE